MFFTDSIQLLVRLTVRCCFPRFQMSSGEIIYDHLASRMSCIRICILAKELLAISYCPLVLPMTIAVLSVFSEEETFYVPNTNLFCLQILYTLLSDTEHSKYFICNEVLYSGFLKRMLISLLLLCRFRDSLLHDFAVFPSRNVSNSRE